MAKKKISLVWPILPNFGNQRAKAHWPGRCPGLRWGVPPPKPPGCF